MKILDRSPVVEKPHERPAQWEYRQARMEADADISQFGAEGWELVAVVPVSYDPSTCNYWFKRRRG
jgi:hypothetical protein